jgi:hypothetical protein
MSQRCGERRNTRWSSAPRSGLKRRR